MSAERWRKVRMLFESAIPLDASGRSSLLDERCAFDETLKGEVVALLAAYERSETFMEEPALGLAAGSRIGPYRLERQIGCGGMGAVYLASRTDGTYERRVAIKLVHANLRSPELLERFRAERQMLALLDHPNISRMLDGGETRSGVPYLVMEYIDGLPIDEYSKQRNLTIEERLRLVRQVCAAVWFAHRNLIIHRDIKSGNVLVDGEGNAKLLDFGVARLMDFSPEQTRAATLSRVFTPEYASPEQLSGKPATTLSDEYSLGVLLHKLMEGLAVPADLQCIIAKATREEADARYSSVEAFSADLERFLGQQPVLARAGQLRYRAWKFVQRRKTPIVSAAAILILASLAGIFALRQQRRVDQERALTEMRTAEVQRLAGSFLAELHDAGRDLNAARAMRARLIPGMLAQLDKLASAPGPNEELTRALALGYADAGDLQQELGDVNHAGETYGKALRQYKKIALPEPVLTNRLTSVEETSKRLNAGQITATGESMEIPSASIASASLMGPLGGPIGSFEYLQGYGHVGCSGVRTSDQKTVPHGSVSIKRIAHNELRVRVTLRNGDPNAVYAIGLFGKTASCSPTEATGTGNKLTTDSSGDGGQEFLLHLPYVKGGYGPITG
ncbi:MAG: serine/threonine protein kinase, partial [Acidobacteriota bacterium]|nr:serine/threonine protein kinase [Acidobacteriota bacterium]